MNGVYWHFGDYFRDTYALTPIEHGTYLLLLSWYYVHERPIPSTWQDVCLDINCKDTNSKHVVYKILCRFFEQKEDGWHHKRADKALSLYEQKAPEREQRKANNKARQQRFALIRKIYVSRLRAAGCNVKGTMSIAELRQLAGRLSMETAISEEIANAVSEWEKANGIPPSLTLLGADRGQLTPNRLDTFTNTISNSANAVRGSLRGAAAGAAGADSEPAPVSVEQSEAQTAEAVANVARRAGLGYVNSKDAALLALIARGATLADFDTAVEQCRLAGKSWAYMLGIVRNRTAPKRAQEGPKSGQEGAKVGWREALLAANAKAALNDVGAVEQNEG